MKLEPPFHALIRHAPKPVLRKPETRYDWFNELTARPTSVNSSTNAVCRVVMPTTRPSTNIVPMMTNSEEMMKPRSSLAI